MVIVLSQDFLDKNQDRLVSVKTATGLAEGNPRSFANYPCNRNTRLGSPQLVTCCKQVNLVQIGGLAYHGDDLFRTDLRAR